MLEQWSLTLGKAWVVIVAVISGAVIGVIVLLARWLIPGVIADFLTIAGIAIWSAGNAVHYVLASMFENIG